MKYFRLIGALMLGFGLSACAAGDTATRNAPLESPALQAAPLSLDVQGVRVSVPKSLKVSERNRYYPGGDIVWREDPRGDRHAQVRAIFEAGLNQGIAEMDHGTVPVILDVIVTRFHALSEKARYTIGGVHAVQFKFVLRNPETGEAYGEPKFVKADFKAYGGQMAINAESKGLTQKARITHKISEVIRQELQGTGGYHAEANGLIGALNQL
ncbi:hypothetical protein SAMN05444414_11382 [Roseovarius marisflavi]|uniref:Lipoprotein n=1 Tax=Roseovarius marisflavi TaxID=1054996 RepID=A0A1M7AGT9_9RHOB|nr:DUF6778 family protein [Roseovarius marisflavi]SHL41825.1 hypothetical protein SAMN05444414_11382 [Roseovarius marisflavi]